MFIRLTICLRVENIRPFDLLIVLAGCRSRRGRGRGGGGAESQHSTDSESGRTARRHSVDTVSTYLSHESKDSLQQASVGSLLNCSAGSDDVFEAPPPLPALPPPALPPPDAHRGMSGSGPAVCVWVGAVAAPHWDAPCPRCHRPLGGAGAGAGAAAGAGAGAGAGAVALLACHHMMHLHCLDTQLAQRPHEPLYIECLVCGRVYGQEGGAPGGAPGARAAARSMAWRLEPGALPGFEGAGSILVTYKICSGHPVVVEGWSCLLVHRSAATALALSSCLVGSFQSGWQSARHPAPGAPYYAGRLPATLAAARHAARTTGFSMDTLVLTALRAAWERRVLFTVATSQTTGREHVVAWRAAPPPASRAHYGRGARAALAATLRDLDRLVGGAADPPLPV
ncbi:hypothetical protein MSG28_013987 [Choristoneura fumiferana]|uniref:Uncharacterized protein n=1 Tax=Choristoneura fumiferana TaxID=7141 RepID=A0ACC0K9P7_CHOFU|nr:hypothetical protein MSG28_013987 [Choristoneura fumiferana]